MRRRHDLGCGRRPPVVYGLGLKPRVNQIAAFSYVRLMLRCISRSLNRSHAASPEPVCVTHSRDSPFAQVPVQLTFPAMQ